MYYSKSRLQCLLYLVSICFWSCKQHEEKQLLNYEKANIISIKKVNNNDSLTLSVRFSGKSATNFNVVDEYLQFSSLVFKNPLEKDTIISKNKSKTYDSQVLNYSGGQFVDGKIQFYKHLYLMDSNVMNLKFEYNNGDIILKTNKEVFLADTLFIKYNQFRSKASVVLNENDIKNLQIELDDMFNFFKESYLTKNLSYASVLNEYHYFDKLQIIKPTDMRVESYLKQLDTVIVGEPLNNLIFFYVKNKVDGLNYKKLNTKNYSQTYIKLLSIGVYKFLRHEDYKGDKKYQKALDWHKTTELYKNDSIYIKKETTPMNSGLFTLKLENLNFTNLNEEKIKLKQIVNENSNDFYLISFWATWCAPCIKGVKTMKKMDMPKNVYVISVSLDKEKDKKKWIKMTKDLKQPISLWLDETNKSSKEFLKFIELKSIPRYILIDRNMNLIDQAFYHPQEPQFLSKLQELIIH